MACFVNPIEGERCVCLSFEGEIPPRELATMGCEAQRLVNARPWLRIMVDITQLRSSLTVPRLLDFAKVLSGQIPRNAQLALVARPDQAQHANLLE
jgi:hypothetical protein